ncbi:hypothetical protein [Pseudomonas monteilii]|uniref:hypothetical protein n=1 Tax=Pseudomonas monteilii TaxID=76759 RepID=UPI0015FA205F|nr:hypothetical protein [Pseudomonas monteilii]MBA6105291.1 hypothetical protein [Pseudomonas monteilii]
MKITIETIENLQKSLKDLPVVEDKKREVSKPEAVKMLAADVAEMQKKGYTIEMIAEILTNSGLEIKPSTLKSYLTRAKAPSGTRKRGTKKTSRSTPSTQNAGSKKASSSADQKHGSAKDLTQLGGKSKTSGKAETPTIGADVKGNSTEPLRSGTFQVRDDSPEI